MPTALYVAAIVAVISQSFVFFLAGGLDGFVIGWSVTLSALGAGFAFITITFSE